MSFFAGRWQAPLALAAVAAAGLAVWSLFPKKEPVDFEALMADVRALERGDAVDDALSAGEQLLSNVDVPLAEAQQAIVHDYLADVLYRKLSTDPEPDAREAQRLLSHHEEALRLGRGRQPGAALRGAFARALLGDRKQAARDYQAALNESLSPRQQRVAIQRLIDLLDNDPEATKQRAALLDRLLSDDTSPPEYAWWALQRAIGQALDSQDSLAAHALLERATPRFGPSGLKGYLEYLNALVLLHEGRTEQAEPIARWVEQWLEGDERFHFNLDEYGNLPAMNRWLLGKIALAQADPAAALGSFEQARQLRPQADLLIAATVGCGQAQAALQHDAEARSEFEAALAQLERKPQIRQRAVEEFREALVGLYEGRRRAGDPRSALPYLRMAMELAAGLPRAKRGELTQRLATACREAAGAADGDEQRTDLRDAGRALEQCADLAGGDDAAAADLLWNASQQYDAAGQAADVTRTLKRFVAGRRDHPRLPRALLQLGQAAETQGSLTEALRWYDRVAREYPKLEEAAHARQLAAGCLVALGPAHFAEAERRLGDLLEGGDVSPTAAVFRDALLELCDLLYEQNRFGEAISRLENFLALFADDPARKRAEFMLADAYRRSALELQERAAAAASQPAAAAASQPGPSPARALAASSESRARFQRAAELFDQFLADRPARGESEDGDGSNGQYTRLAMLYRGDCLFELNDPESLAEALNVYRATAARYDAEPAALSAQVQIANICLRQGNLIEAARSIERARWQLRSMPEQAFADAAGGLDRAHWDKYLATIASSELFRDVFAGAQ